MPFEFAGRVIIVAISPCHFGGQAGEQAVERPVAGLTKLFVRLFDVIRHHDRLADSGIRGDLAVYVLAAALTAIVCFSSLGLRGIAFSWTSLAEKFYRQGKAHPL